MLTKQVILQQNSTITTMVEHREINRLLAAAVVSSNFRKLLLSDPMQAIQSGYAGEKFNLSEDELNIILSIQSISLTDFAAQLFNKFTGNFITPTIRPERTSEAFWSM
jgi:hypothetical protein